MKRALKSIYQPVLVALARRVRQGRPDVVYLGVTGSCAKTTTKDLIEAVLRRRFHGVKTSDSNSGRYAVARALLGLRRRSGFCVAELGTSGPGTLDGPIALLRPSIGVVTHIANDHFKAFRSLEATAAEKGKLIDALPEDGTAILNADDPNVVAMAKRCRGHVVRYGFVESADLRALHASSTWPERLSVDVQWRGETRHVETRLCGEHWVSAVLAALAAGLACGMTLAEAAEGIATCDPWPGRMSPVAFEDGVTFVRDDWKAPYWSVPAAIEFAKQARARRRIVVLGTISDYGGASTAKYVKLARSALAFADRVLLVGERSQGAMRIQGEFGDRLLGFPRIRDASTFLEAEVEPGDLVLIKGSHGADHLGRLTLARDHDVRCWREQCHRENLCDFCPLLGVASDEAKPTASGSARDGG